jgi:hypothetical protein
MVRSRQAGAEIEVTRAMEEAGVETFLEHYPDTGAGDFQDYRMVREIFLAMATVSVSAGSNKAGSAYSGSQFGCERQKRDS